ncbi:hypothetical protein B0A75_07345 [Flavobacterium oncorhynchi]|uniref:Uncharacterized protein n=1 Tax=Flavobacterium oncorhynchi TaxID=728056 RepID=A0A226I472_9FLAO|nr:hypothetical protein [Flavobacterium oncorhynchi]OXB01370.1 hypothetical protein B0A75_07345 [Flavobacterium oncorhynchi]
MKKKISLEKFAIFFVSILIATNTGFYIWGKVIASKKGNEELFSVPLLIAIAISTSISIFAIFRKK